MLRSVATIALGLLASCDASPEAHGQKRRQERAEAEQRELQLRRQEEAVRFSRCVAKYAALDPAADAGRDDAQGDAQVIALRRNGVAARVEVPGMVQLCTPRIESWDYYSRQEFKQMSDCCEDAPYVRLRRECFEAERTYADAYNRRLVGLNSKAVSAYCAVGARP